MMYVSSKLVLFATIILHSVVFQATLDAKTLFMSMAILNNVQFTMTQLMPRAITLGAESLVSLIRIAEFLQEDEVSCSSKHEGAQGDLAANQKKSHHRQNIPKLLECSRRRNSQRGYPIKTQAIVDRKQRALIEFESVSARWASSETQTLENISFTCQSGDLIFICGQVACGKSSLLMVLLNELPILTGRASIRGTCSYSSQSPWIFDGTVRDNIVFGSPFNEHRYKQTIEACALMHDFELLDYGDMTYIQENSLSGGQKARVNLARCLYRDCDIYLLDDPFSALDRQVANFIFEHAVKRLLSDKLVLLTTHKVDLLRHSNNILLIDQGKLLAFCDPRHLAQIFATNKPLEEFTDDQLERLSFLRADIIQLLEDGSEREVLFQTECDQVNIIGQSEHNHDAKRECRLAPDQVTYQLESSKADCGGANHSKGHSISQVALSSRQPEACVNYRSIGAEVAYCCLSKCECNDKCEFPHHERPECELADEQVSSAYGQAKRACLMSDGNETAENRSGNGDGDGEDDRARGEICVVEMATRKTTSESILSSPYGFSDLAKGDRDKNLITTGKEAQNDPSSPIAFAVANPASNNVMVMNTAVAGGLDGSKKGELVKQDLRQESSAKVVSVVVVVGHDGVEKEEAERDGEGKEEDETTEFEKRKEGAEWSVNKVDVNRAGTMEAVLVSRYYRPTMNKFHQQENQQQQVDNSKRQPTNLSESSSSCLSSSDSLALNAAACGSAPFCLTEPSSCTKDSLPDESNYGHHYQQQQQQQGERDLSCANKKTPPAGGGFVESRNEPAQEDIDTTRMPGLRVWFQYYTQTSLTRLLLIVLTFLLTQAIFSTVDIYLTVWSMVEQNTLLLNDITITNDRYMDKFNQYVFLNENDRLHYDYDFDDERNKTGPTSNVTFNNIIAYDWLQQLGNPGVHLDLSSAKSIDNGTSHHDKIRRLMLAPGASISDAADAAAKIGLLIQKLHISPLSQRSSGQMVLQEEHLNPSNTGRLSLFVPLLNLFHFSNCPTEVERKKYHSQAAGASLDYESIGNQEPTYELYEPSWDAADKLAVSSAPAIVDHRKEELELGLQLNMTSAMSRIDAKLDAESIVDGTGIDGEQQSGNASENEGTAGASAHDAPEANLVSPLFVVDSTIAEESKEASNVKAIYRPLYLFVNHFTSNQHALTYASLLTILLISSMVTNILSLTSSNKSAIALYKKLTDNALFAKIAFFDQNPPGRFLNRATRDIGIIDEAIPYNANQAYDALLKTAATFIVVAAVDVNLALPSLVVLFVFLIFHSIHIKPTKDIQRLVGTTKSPIVSHVSTTLSGLHTIRATKSEARFEQMFMGHQDRHTSVFLLYLGCDRYTAVVLDCLNTAYTGVVASWAVLAGLGDSSAGLIITSAMLLGGLTQHGIMKLTATESLMTSVERVIEYCSLPQEEGYHEAGKGTSVASSKSKGIARSNQRKVLVGWLQSWTGAAGCDLLSSSAICATEQQTWKRKDECFTARKAGWPDKGILEYRQVDLYYRKFGKPVLRNVSFKLKPGEKVGVIGRTGAGKSSIIASLFRLYDYEGTILLDGVDIKSVSLFQLRSSLGIIPQNPVLFSTSVRRNLDPFDAYDDYSLWQALDKAHLRKTVSSLPGKLDYNIGSGGALSTGQKQLMCLARVLLRQSSVIVMDEATANVDPNTDAIIQATIRREFKRFTVITIAHRIETILDYDRIMVLEAGRIVGFDTPEQLAAEGNIYFTSLLNKTVDGTTS